MSNARVVSSILAASLAAAVALVAAGCNSPVVGSCDFRPSGGNRCFDYTADSVGTGKSICTGGKKWTDKPCDLAGSIGGCNTGAGITKWLYPGEKITDRASAATECTDWTEPTKK